MSKMVLITVEEITGDRRWFMEAPENVKEDPDLYVVEIWNGIEWQEFENALVEEVEVLEKKTIYEQYNFRVEYVKFKNDNLIEEGYRLVSYHQGDLYLFYFDKKQLAQDEGIYLKK
jgi:hypothetical protein